MSYRQGTFLGFALIEWVVAVLVLLGLARLIWAEEVVAFEDRLFESIGLNGGAKYFVTVPLAFWYLYWLFRREQVKARQDGRQVVRPQVLFILLGLVALVTVVVMFL